MPVSTTSTTAFGAACAIFARNDATSDDQSVHSKTEGPAPDNVTAYTPSEPANGNSKGSKGQASLR